MDENDSSELLDPELRGRSTGSMVTTQLQPQFAIVVLEQPNPNPNLNPFGYILFQNHIHAVFQEVYSDQGNFGQGNSEQGNSGQGNSGQGNSEKCQKISIQGILQKSKKRFGRKL